MKDFNQILIEYLIENNIIFEIRKTACKIQEIWFNLFKEQLSHIQSINKTRLLKSKGFNFKYEKNSNQIFIEYINKPNFIFEKGKKTYQIQTIWLKLFNKKISLTQCQNKLKLLNMKDFNFKYKKNQNQIFIEYINEKEFHFEKEKTKYQIQEIWIELFNEKLSLKQCSNKIRSIKEMGGNFKYKKDFCDIFIEYATNNDLVFNKMETSYQIQKLWFELFNKKLSLQQSKNKLVTLKNRGFIFEYKKDYYEILIEYIKENHFTFDKGKVGKQIQELWLKLFNEKLSSRESNNKLYTLEKRGLNFEYKKDSCEIFIDYVNKNNFIFKKEKKAYQIQKLWLELFNEKLSLRLCYHRIETLKNRGLNFIYENDSYDILIDYLITNNLIFERGKIITQMKVIWLELFNEKLSLMQLQNKTNILRKRGFIFKYKKDFCDILIEYATNNDLVFNKSGTSYQIQKLWFELFNKKLSLQQSKNKLVTLKNRGFIFEYKKDYYEILIEYIKENHFTFDKGKVGKQIQELWLKLFNEKLTRTQSNTKLIALKKRGFIFKENKKTYDEILIDYLNKNGLIFSKGKVRFQLQDLWTKLFQEKITLNQCNEKIRIIKKKGFDFKYKKSSFDILLEYLIKTNFIFEKGKKTYQIQTIWLKLFNEKISLSQCQNKIISLRRRDFNFKYKKSSYEILIDYLTKTNFIFEKRNRHHQIQTIWLKLFNEKLSIDQAKDKIYILADKGFIFEYKKDSYQILINYLKKNQLWLEESTEYCIKLQNIWRKLFNEEITLKKANSVIIKISILSPNLVYRKIHPDFVDFYNLDQLPLDKYTKHCNIFASFCRNNNIFLTENIEEKELTRIWSVCFAKN